MCRFVRSALLGLLVAGVVSILVTSPATALSVNFTDRSWDDSDNEYSFPSHTSGIDLAAIGSKVTANYNFQNEDGERNLNFNNLSRVNYITLKKDKDSYSDYPVKKPEYTAVPEPSTLLLLGCGFFLIAILHRRGYFPSV